MLTIEKVEELQALFAKTQEMQPYCCGNYQAGADYMGQQEQVCCGCPDYDSDAPSDEAFDNALRPVIGDILALAREALSRNGEYPIEDAPYATNVLAWLHLPKNPPASGWVIASRVYAQQDDPEDYGDMRITVGCWWANGRYYHIGRDTGYITTWQPLPTPPEE